MKRIGILTSGGDCQGLNASIRGVAKSLYEEFGNDVEIYGIKDGYKGLIFGEYKLMKPEDFSGILTLGGTILGTSRQPFKLMRVIDETSVDKVKNMKDNYKKMKPTASSSSVATAHRKPQTFCARKASMSSPCRRPSTTTSGAPI